MSLRTQFDRMFRPSATERSQSIGAPVEAQVEKYDGYCVQGWVRGASDAGQVATVEAVWGEGKRAVALVDRPRPDLSIAGEPGGHRGFVLPLPPEAWNRPIEVRLGGTDIRLGEGPVAPEWRAPVALVAGDIVNNCNLRCPFCLVDYANIRRLSTMPMDLFRRTFGLLPHVARGHMWLSCLHEPTLHPEFMELIEAVPEACRDRISFTTNFCKRLPDEMLERLASSGIAQVRVSFDSDDPELFRALRVGGRWEVFHDNLLRFRSVLARHTVRPSLHFITMAFCDNAEAIPELVKRGVELYGGDTHEVRFIYYFPHVAEWGDHHVLSLEGWRKLEEALAPGIAAERVSISGPRAGVWDDFKEKRGLAEYVHTETSFCGADNAMGSAVPTAAEVAVHMPDEPLRLRLRWDGLTVIEQIPEGLCRFNLANIADPGTYFAEIRNLARVMGPAPGSLGNE